MSIKENFNMKKLIITMIWLGICFPALAHQPRYVFNKGDINEPIIVEKPEISKAYYGKLDGRPAWYKIQNEKEFNLYLNILAPDLNDAQTDFRVEVTKDNSVVFVLEGGEWERFFEEFAGDSYLRGPELEKIVEAGTYYVTVSNPDNQGRYCLAVGKAESFPPAEIAKTIFVLPRIKKDFFDKSPFTAFFNLVGLFLLIILIFILLIVFAVFYLIKRLKRRKVAHLIAQNERQCINV